MQKSYGQINFESYSKCRNGIDYKGNPIPAWENLSQEIQGGWETGAHAVIWNSSNTDDPWLAIQVAYAALKKAKPNDKSDTDRRYAIAITKMEDVISHVYTWIQKEGIF